MTAAPQSVPQLVELFEGDRDACRAGVPDQGRLALGGRTVEVCAKCVMKEQTKMADRGAPGLAMDACFTVKGCQLGLARLDDQEIDVRIGLRGTFPRSGPDPAKALTGRIHR